MLLIGPGSLNKIRPPCASGFQLTAVTEVVAIAEAATCGEARGIADTLPMSVPP